MDPSPLDDQMSTAPGVQGRRHASATGTIKHRTGTKSPDCPICGTRPSRSDNFNAHLISCSKKHCRRLGLQGSFRVVSDHGLSSIAAATPAAGEGIRWEPPLCVEREKINAGPLSLGRPQPLKLRIVPTTIHSVHIPLLQRIRDIWTSRWDGKPGPKPSRAVSSFIQNLGQHGNCLAQVQAICEERLGFSLLALAVYTNDHVLVPKLVNADANLGFRGPIRVRGVRGGHRLVKGSALHIAANFGRCALAVSLINRGADVNGLTSEMGNVLSPTDPLYRGRPPLHLAIMGGHADMAELLLEKGADVHAVWDGRHEPYDQTRSFRTALGIAAAYHDSEMVGVLLRHGAKPDIQEVPKICGLWRHDVRCGNCDRSQMRIAELLREGQAVSL